MHVQSLLIALNVISIGAVSQTIVIPNSSAGPNSTIKGTSTFSGEAWIDNVYRDSQTVITNVMFTPSSRTYWHTHEQGQALRVIAGSGWICDKGGEPQKLNTGDVAWCPPGTTHWHGADEGSYMIHFAVAHGRTEWLDEVTDEEYGAIRSSLPPHQSQGSMLI